ncbi:MAG: GAF domain-containing protein [Anaerolineales bacterium]
MNFGSIDIEPLVYRKWREGLMRPILTITLAFGFISMIAAIFTDQNITQTLIFIGAYISVVLVAVTPMPFWLRAGIILTAIYALGLNELFSLGIEGDGIFFFLGFITVTTMFFSPRGGIIAIAISLITFGIMGWLILGGRVALITPVPAALADWISNSVITLVFGSIIVVGFRQLDAEYAKAQKTTEEATQELENEKAGLEDRVAERTLQFKAVNEVGRVASSVLDPNELINRLVNIITDQFGFYYTAIFLVDSTKRWAELKSATGEAGRVLKENNHRLEVGGKSMVGTAISLKTPRVALDVGAEPTRFENPLLPYTRSEIALPLLAGDRVLGALDVQSTHEGAFGPQEIDTLQNMANQVAIALENANLFQQVQQNLDEIRAIQRQDSLQNWNRVASRENLHYEVGDQEQSGTENELEVSLAMRDGVIGEIRMDSDNEWTPEQRNLIESIAAQASLALENARLVEEGLSTATRERLISEISGKIWASNTMDGILRTAVQELGRALSVSEATIELNTEENS